MNRIINYTTGGLGNRLRPLSSAYAISKTTGRGLYQFWDSKTTNGCLAKFDELFENKIDIIDEDDLSNITNGSIYSSYDAILRLSTKYSLNDLKGIVDNEKVVIKSQDSFNYFDSENDGDIVIYCNNFIPNTNRDLCHEFIQNLTPISILRDKIEFETKSLGLNKNVIGVHARGTDFNSDIDFYVRRISERIVNSSDDTKFFISTDDQEFDKILKSRFNEKIITRQDRLHLNKINENSEWDYNFIITKEKSQDSVVDLFLLSKTNIEIYDPRSTFCEIAQIISNKH